MFGVFRVKNHDFTPKNHFFSNFRGGRAPGAPPPPWIRPCKTIAYYPCRFYKSPTLFKLLRFAVIFYRKGCVMSLKQLLHRHFLTIEKKSQSVKWVQFSICGTGKSMVNCSHSPTFHSIWLRLFISFLNLGIWFSLGYRMEVGRQQILKRRFYSTFYILFLCSHNTIFVANVSKRKIRWNIWRKIGSCDRTFKSLYNPCFLIINKRKGIITMQSS